MAKQRSTYSKFQRERDKQAKAAAKREKRALKGTEEEEGTEVTEPVADQGAVLDALAALHEEYEAGGLSTEDFEQRRDDLRAKIDLG
ncbi:MAG TPA: hypothetical protein VF230_15865 [Acidimicrobiales bacterium]